MPLRKQVSAYAPPSAALSLQLGTLLGEIPSLDALLRESAHGWLRPCPLPFETLISHPSFMVNFSLP